MKAQAEKSESNKFYFHMHKQNRCKSGSDLTYEAGLLTWGCADVNRIGAVTQLVRVPGS